MLAQLLVPTIALAATVNAHSFVLSAFVNGVDTWDGTTLGEPASYLRAPGTNSPVQDITATALACNVKGHTEVTGSLTVQAGDTLESEWWHAGERGTDPIDPSHKGIYNSNGEGDVWVKIAEEGWSTTTSDWATDRMIANGGRNAATIPATLAPGQYLVRFDLLALHSASAAPPNGAQFYPSCAQLTVEGSGTQALPAGIAIPGAFTDDTPGIVWNIYYSTDYDVHTDYVIPGPAVWDGSATYPTAQCTTPLDGVASPRFCYDGFSSNSSANSTAVSSAAAMTSSASVMASSAVANAASSVLAPSDSSAFITRVAVSPSAVAASVAVSSGAASSHGTGSTTLTAEMSQVTDYSGCMRIYNACLDAANAKQAAAGGGAVDFSSCADTCASEHGRRAKRGRVGRAERRLGH